MKTVVTHSKFLCKSRNQWDAVCRQRRKFSTCPVCGGPSRTSYGSARFICWRCSNKNLPDKELEKRIKLQARKDGVK